MTTDEKRAIKEIKEELVVMRLQLKTLSESEFRKSLDRALKLLDKIANHEV